MSLLALYGLGGYLVSSGLMPLRTLLSAVGFTFSLVFSSQGVVQSLTDGRRALAAIARSELLGSLESVWKCPRQNLYLFEADIIFEKVTHGFCLYSMSLLSYPFPSQKPRCFLCCMPSSHSMMCHHYQWLSVSSSHYFTLRRMLDS